MSHYNYGIINGANESAPKLGAYKIKNSDASSDPVIRIRDIIDYKFVIENLLRQAFTRRAFAVQNGIAV